MVDDLLSVVHHRERYGVQIRTPHLNKLTSQGLSFSNAFCTAAVCNASRTSIVSGRNPYKTGIHDNVIDWWDRVDPWLTFPGRLRQVGYLCLAYGKITHGRYTAWQDICAETISGPDDAANVNAAINRMDRLATSTNEGPFLLMVGLQNPHLPFESPPRFYEHYPLASISPLDWRGDMPSHPELVEGQRRIFRRLEAAGEMDDYIQGYLANVTEMDYYLGKLIEAFDSLGLSATVILSSDHGYHLGEHDVVSKFTLWDEAGRAPLVIRHPPGAVGRYQDVVSLLDIAPTIMDIAGLRSPADWDGLSLAPLLNDPTRRRLGGAVTNMIRTGTDNGESNSLRTNHFRYTRYFDGSTELYDSLDDPLSKRNLSGHPDYAGVERHLSSKLRDRLAQWKSRKKYQ
jgi:arylsulfatase A-like enzyme